MTTNTPSLEKSRDSDIAFWVVAAPISSIVLGANTPLPLLTLYQTQWHFSTGMLSIVYGLYTVGVVIAVFLLGPLSDTVGRKRVLIPSLLMMAAGLLTCLLAMNVWILLVGRVLQGLAVGAGTTTAVAALGELHPGAAEHDRNALTATVAVVVGLAGGPLVAGSLAEYAPAPTVTPYIAALALVALTLIGLLKAPETVADPKGFALRPARIHIPTSIAPAFYRATFVEMTAYAVAGTFAGLGSSFAQDLLAIPGHFAAGLVVALLFISSAVGQVGVRRWPFDRAMRLGLLILLVGLGLFAGALPLRSRELFYLSAVILGLGHGLAYLGTQELIDRIAPPGARAEVFSGFQLGLYAGATIPAVLVGFAAKSVGLQSATFAFVGVIGVLALIGVFWRGPASPVNT